MAVGCRAGDHRLGPAQAGLGRAPCLWPSLPASAPLTEPNLPFLDPTDKFPTGLSTPDFGALLIRPILADQPLGPVNASRASESFLDRGKGPPDARGRSPKGSFLSWKRNPIYQDQSAGGARKRHVFCAVCPYRPACWPVPVAPNKLGAWSCGLVNTTSAY